MPTAAPETSGTRIHTANNTTDRRVILPIFFTFTHKEMRLMVKSDVHFGLVPWRIFLHTTVLLALETYRLNKPITNTPTPPRRNIAPRTVPTYVLGARRNIPTTAPKIPAIINPILTMRYPSTTTMFMIIKMV
jgi:hypothetical protein